MEITLTEGPGHLLVRARGCLSLRTVTELRDTLLKAAAEQPRGVVCDLREVTAGPVSLTVLHVVADQVAEWPGTPLVLVADDHALTDHLERLGLLRRLPVVADPDAAWPRSGTHRGSSSRRAGSRRPTTPRPQPGRSSPGS